MILIELFNLYVNTCERIFTRQVFYIINVLSHKLTKCHIIKLLYTYKYISKKSMCV